MRFPKRHLLLVGLLLVAILTLALACSSNGGGQKEVNPQASGLTTVLPSKNTNLSGAEASGLSGAGASLQGSITAFEGGISVSGTGTVTVSPDVVVLVLGVEARRDTVAQARDEAAQAMQRIVQVLRDNAVADADIRTQYLSIQPIYEYRTDAPVLTGFQVNNVVAAEIRDLDRVGAIIDQAVDAGGDLTRIQSIGFSVDDPAPLEAELRSRAVADAVAKAQQLASLTGVTLGKPVSIVEGGGGVPVYDLGVRALAEAAAPATSVSPGQVELTLNVSIVFAIQ